MKKRTVLLGIVAAIPIIAAITYALQWFVRSLGGSTSAYYAAFSTPITFYGKVVDQFGEPVPEAEISAKAHGNSSGAASTQATRTSPSGLFEFHGMHGAYLGVDVSKDGYYRLLGWQQKGIGSSAGFQYASVGGQPVHLPNKSSPVIFELHKQGTLEPLEQIGPESSGLPVEGTPIMLEFGPKDLVHKPSFLIRAWSNENEKTDRGTYDWKVDIRINDGGIAPRQDRLDFIAPESGYSPSVTIEMPANLARPAWQDVIDRMYFVRFSNGTFARVRFDIAAPPHGSVRISGFINPKVGSRNLEADPNKR
jgi:hypothetical protein